jgi:hypothetical protein
MPRLIYTSYTSKKRKKKDTPALIKAKKDHDKWLRANGVHPDQIKRSVVEYRNTPLVKNEEIVEKVNYKSSNNIGGVAAKRKVNYYSGERKLLGIAAMHKSNLVPVFEADDAKELAKMRRG